MSDEHVPCLEMNLKVKEALNIKSNCGPGFAEAVHKTDDMAFLLGIDWK